MLFSAQRTKKLSSNWMLRMTGLDICGCVPLTFFSRGIDIVRNKIKMFAQKKVHLPPGRHKIIILDEADRWRFPHYILGDWRCSLFLLAWLQERNRHCEGQWKFTQTQHDSRWLATFLHKLSSPSRVGVPSFGSRVSQINRFLLGCWKS